MADLRGRKGRAPPGGQNSFNFMQFLGKFGKFVCWRPLLGEILDPPLVTEDDDVNADFSRWTFCTGRVRHWLCALGSGVVNRKLRFLRFPPWWRQHSGGVPASGYSDLSPHWTASSPLATMEICLQFINFTNCDVFWKLRQGLLSISIHTL